MRNTITLLSIVLLVACNSVKRNEKFLARGNYDQAIELAVKKLQKDKNSKKGAEHIVLLEEAYAKAAAQDTRRIAFLETENSPEGTREIYNLYNDLEYRQRLLRPLLPINNPFLGREAKFVLVDYSKDIIAAKEGYALSLYQQAKGFMARNTREDYRKAYMVLEDITELKSNYKDVRTLMEDAHYNGTDFVHVTLNNRTGQLIPQRLERDLLDFSTYNLDDFWTVYHSERQRDINYDFGIVFSFKEIAISPEKIAEKEYVRKDRVKDGWKYKLDRNGNVVKDSLGNDIKIAVFKDVTARVTVTEQTKSVFVGGDVIYRDLNGGRDMDRFPLSSEFIFENIFAKYRGDKRALTTEDKNLIRYDFLHFPSNEQMVYDAGTDIKARLSEILKQNSFY